jgi:hypothetical protein
MARVECEKGTLRSWNRVRPILVRPILAELYLWSPKPFRGSQRILGKTKAAEGLARHEIAASGAC